ncbi:MAG: S9 family peptidase [bacterium]|nr:S9 family peptidase [bacterium]
MSFFLGHTYNIKTSDQPVKNFAWSPNGKYIAFLMLEPDPEKESIKVLHKDSDFLSTHLWLIDLETKKQTRITTGNFIVTDFDFSPDGKQIVFSSQQTPEIKDALASSAGLINIKTKKISMVESGKKIHPVWKPEFSTDGNYIYYLTLADDWPQMWLGATKIAVYNLENKKTKIFDNNGDDRINKIYACSPDSNRLYYQVEQGVSYQLYSIDINTEKTEQITTGNHCWENFIFSKDFTKAAFTRENENYPQELFLSSFPELHLQQMTFVNSVLKNRDSGRTEIIHWQSSDGTIIEGLLVKPVNFDPAKKYPLLVRVHGGPANCVSNRFANGRWSYPTQTLASKGIMILLPNPRGSTGYGEKFKRELILNWGELDYEDVMTGIDYLINDIKIVDPDRLGIAGWSYGGYLTAMIISRTDRFRAASVGAGFVNIVSLFGTNDMNDWIPYYFKELPYDKPELYVKHSPLFRIKNIKTPVLIQHGQNDKRVPVSQAKEFFTALKHTSADIELVVYPGEGHILRKPENITDSLQRNVSWFENYLIKYNNSKPEGQF